MNTVEKKNKINIKLKITKGQTDQTMVLQINRRS
jgi:hypothetical protein